jgi:hypothetical protein
MIKRVLLWVMTVVLLTGSARPAWAKPTPRPAPDVPAKAGQISALLPVAHVVRGAGRAAVTTDAKRGEELIWNDLVKTDKGGRARITLTDQSILSLGSQAELRIVKHDARTQQTSLQMAYGRVRAQVASITRTGGSFELRTPTAVAGVIGTDFGVDSSSVGGDTFICIAGAVQVANADPNVPGAVQCNAGQTTTVQPGKSPTAPVPASLQQLQQLIEDTEPAIISSITPAAALPGTNFDSNIAGAKMSKVNSVTVAGSSGVTATIKSATDTSVQVHIVIDPNASPGPRTITLAKETGSSSATVFTVLGTPIGDPKKAYLDTLDQLRSTGIGGLGAFLTGAQQAADQVAQQITQANQNLPKPLDLSPFSDALNRQYGVLSNDFKGGTGAVDKAAQDAATTFAGLYDTAYQSLLQRDATGTPDTTFRNALTAAFTQANAILQAALQSTQTGLNGALQIYGNQLNTIQQAWSQNINAAFQAEQSGPQPKVNALERIVELGATTSFDANSSSTSNSSDSINGYQWTLCAQNYQPSAFGQVLAPGTAACNGIQGFVSTSSEFQIATCSLQPGSYYARLAVTDSNSRVSQMDVKLTVLAPNYPTPGGTVRALADAYTSLQLSQFLRWFDAAQFNGYTPLSENIRQTMQSLASMAINLRLSQENVTCNDATVRADWQQNYSFIGDPKTVFNQTEQLSVRLQRTPGTGWLIADFQGDNGRVQGVPGPQTTDTAAPDLEIVSTTIDGRPVSAVAPLQVAAGPHSVVVNIANNGSAPLSGSVSFPVVITIQDTNGTNVTTVDTFKGTVPAPLSNGDSAPVMAALNVPTSATNLAMLVQVNPSCNPPEKTCGAPNNASYPLILGLPDFSAGFIPTAAVNGIVGRPFSFPAVNVTPSPYPVALTVAYAGLPAGLAAASPANNTTNINGALIAGTPSATGSSTVAATASAAGTTKNVTGSATISIGSEITVTPASAPSFIAGSVAQNLTLTVAGGVYPVTVSLALPTGFTTTSGTVANGISTQVLSAPGMVTYALTAGLTSVVGNQNFVVMATDAGIPASNTPAGNRTLDAPYTVAGLPDLQFGALQVPPAAQMGAVVNATIPVVNSGSATAAAGWNIVVTINGTQAGTILGPAIPAGQTADVAMTLTIPQVGAPPVSTTVPAVATLNSNSAIQELNTGNNTLNANITLVDFLLGTIPTGTAQGVVGRSFDLLAANVAPAPYPLPILVSYTGLTGGLLSSTSANPNGLTGERIVGTPTATGTATINISGNTGSVTHAATGSFRLSITPEITITEPAPPTLSSGGAAQNLTVNVTGGIYPVTLALALPTGITTTSGTINGSISTQTLTSPGSVTWTVAADFTATPGTALITNIVATDAGVPATATPAGNVVFQASYTVSGNSDYSITGFTVTGHNSPYTLADAFQVGETTTFSVTVKNNGNTSPVGNVTITLDCGNPTYCPSALSGTASAPGAGASVTIPIGVYFPNFAVGSYNGSATLSTNVSGAQIGAPLSIPFDIVDFTIGNASQGPFQNLPVGGSATLGVSVAVQRPSGNPFGISITPAPTDSNLVFTPSTQVTAGAFIPFPLAIGSAAVQGQGTVRFNATNHGVTKFVDVPYVAFTANMTSTTLFVNDASNPLLVPVTNGQSYFRYPTVELQLNGNFDHTSGSASLVVQQPGCGSFSAALFPTTAVPNDIVSLPIYAAPGNTCPAGSQVIINADIPQTFPTTTVPVYTLFVAPSGLPLLAVQSATPARDFTSQPWLSGEPVDWTVVVQNTGSGPSSGNEKVTLYAGTGEIGQGTVINPIPAGQTATVTIHTVAPDYPEDNNVGSSLPVRVSVQNDNQGDLDPGSGDLNLVENFSNWGIGISSSSGNSDSNPLMLSPSTPSNTATIAIKNQSLFNPNLNVSLVQGAYSSGQLNAPGFSPNSIGSGSSSTVTVSFPNATAPANGLYFVQVIAQMKDGAIVTAQRQVTIHVQMQSQPNTPAGITLASDRTNIGPPGCTSPTCQTIQINGPLPEAFTLTASVNSCSAGNGCPGSADISFTDSFMTVTTPQVSTVQVTSPGNTLPVRVKAADNPDGSINYGPATVNVSVNAIQASFFGSVRTPTPDPVGTQFVMNFSIGDLQVYAPACVSIPPQDTSAIPLSLSWQVLNGFNVPSVQWEWQDPNHIPIGASPLSFSPANGSSTFSANGYTALPTFDLSNPTNGIDGLQTYYFAFTVNNSVATATKYFPIQVDLSRSQTFCPNLGASRGGGAGRLIRGSWGKAGLSAPSVGTLAARTAANGKLPDLRISASDISFTPSIPKTGDTVAVRFRISNLGDADATGVPVALQVRGSTVASDTFDIPAGKTVLGGLEWAKAQLPAGVVRPATQRANLDLPARNPMRPARYGADTVQPGAVPTVGRFGLQAQIVIDPQKTIVQKTTLAKSAPLAHFDLRNPAADAVTMASIGEQHALLILSEGACGGLKLAYGAGSCSSADLTFTVEDLAQGTYKLESEEGVADLGIGNRSYASASFGMEALLQNGRTYAVQTRGGGVGLVTITAVRSPDQLSEAAKRLFRQKQAVTILKSLGGTTGAPETGDIAGTGSQPVVYFDIVYQSQ